MVGDRGGETDQSIEVSTVRYRGSERADEVTSMLYHTNQIQNLEGEKTEDFLIEISK